jgi:2-polyprenyl-3-methyl-5-hydroxy-6-metoxy-1,4-benzoquinol methylase
MDLNNDYLKNLEVVDRFPWSIYHRPIRSNVLQVIQQEEKLKGPLRILNVGCGLSQILPHIDSRHDYHGVDVDPRAIEICRSRYKVGHFDQCEDYSLPTADDQFDVVFATEVIEHVLDTSRWLKELIRVTRPGGRIQLSTPNYGDFVLPLIENTFLEWVARRKGFTRKGLHPVPFSSAKLAQALRNAGLTEIKVSKTFLWLALTSSARK